MDKETAASKIDMVREVSRNFIGIGAVFAVLWMLYKFVDMSPLGDRMNLQLLIIGYVGGVLTGILAFYFGASMKTGVIQQQQSKGGLINAPENPQFPLQPSSSAVPSVAPNGASGELRPETGSNAGGGDIRG